MPPNSDSANRKKKDAALALIDSKIREKTDLGAWGEVTVTVVVRGGVIGEIKVEDVTTIRENRTE